MPLKSRIIKDFAIIELFNIVLDILVNVIRSLSLPKSKRRKETLRAINNRKEERKLPLFLYAVISYL